jgi:hypothetical protein
MQVLDSLVPPSLTTAQIAALPTGTGRFPKGAVIFNSSTGLLLVNIGTDAAPSWLGPPIANNSMTGLFSGKNNGSLTAITMTSIAWDNIGVGDWTTNAYAAMPDGYYIISGYAQTTGQSGSGGGNLDLQKLDAGGSLVDTLAIDQIPFNGSYTFSAHAITFGNQRIALRTQNGATGTAGTVQGRIAIIRMA